MTEVLYRLHLFMLALTIYLYIVINMNLYTFPADGIFKFVITVSFCHIDIN